MIGNKGANYSPVASKGRKPFKGIIRHLDFDLRASFLRGCSRSQEKQENPGEDNHYSSENPPIKYIYLAVQYKRKKEGK